jgi:hypothetical protein
MTIAVSAKARAIDRRNMPQFTGRRKGGQTGINFY